MTRLLAILVLYSAGRAPACARQLLADAVPPALFVADLSAVPDDLACNAIGCLRDVVRLEETALLQPRDGLHSSLRALRSDGELDSKQVQAIFDALDAALVRLRGWYRARTR